MLLEMSLVELSNMARRIILCDEVEGQVDKLAFNKHFFQL